MTRTEVENIIKMHNDKIDTFINEGLPQLLEMTGVKVVKKDIASVKVVINGAGSAGIAIGKHLLNMGVKNLTMVDKFGIIARDMDGLNSGHREIAELTNPECIHGSLADAMAGADVFVGVSAPGSV